jgi:hypothetical protein
MELASCAFCENLTNRTISASTKPGSHRGTPPYGKAAPLDLWLRLTELGSIVGMDQRNSSLDGLRGVATPLQSRFVLRKLPQITFMQQWSFGTLIYRESMFATSRPFFEMVDGPPCGSVCLLRSRRTLAKMGRHIRTHCAEN